MNWNCSEHLPSKPQKAGSTESSEAGDLLTLQRKGTVASEDTQWEIGEDIYHCWAGPA